MKKIRLSMMAVLAAMAGFVSCEELTKAPEEDAKKMQIDAEQTYEVISTSPKDVTFNINSNTPWTIQSDAAWCKATPASSDESSLVEEITVRFENNEEIAVRTAKLTITGEGIEEPTVITFNQSPKSSLEVEQISKAFTKDGGTAEFTVTSNVAWKAESNQEWLKLDKTEGTGNSKAEVVKVTCAANAGAARKAIITVEGGGDQKTFEVNQDGLFVRFKEASAELRTFKNVGETKAFEFETNATEMEAKADDEGAKVEVKGNKVEVTLDFNGIFTNRKVKVTVFPKGTKAEDYEGNVIELSQPINWDISMKEAGKVVFDPETGNGNLVCKDGGQARIYTQTWNRLGKYEFEFNKVEVGEDFLINFIADNRPPKVFWELCLGKNMESGLENAILFSGGGKCTKTEHGYTKNEKYPEIPDFHGKKFTFDFTSADAKALKKLIVEFKPNESKTEIEVLVQANEKVLVRATLANPYAFEGTHKGKKVTYERGAKCYFGFPGKNWEGKLVNGDGTLEIKSAKFTPYPEK